MTVFIRSPTLALNVDSVAVIVGSEATKQTTDPLAAEWIASLRSQ